MGERSESKRVCRRSALALFGYAAAFGLVASPAILMVSDAGAQTPPATPATPSTETPKSGTERRQERRAGRAERRQERIEFFNTQPPEIKRFLLPFLLLNRRRDALQPAFQFLASNPHLAEGRGGLQMGRDLTLRIASREDTVEFLAAMLSVQSAAMLTAKSALLVPGI